MSEKIMSEKVEVAKRKNQDNGQVVVECPVNVDDEVLKVLSLSTKPVIENVNAGTDITINGKLFINVMYLTTEGNVNSANSVCSFVYKDNTAFEQAKICASVKTIENTVESVTNNTIKVQTIVEVCINVFQNEKLDVLTNPGEDICIKESETTALSLTSEKCENFVETSEITTKDQITKILSVDSGVVVKDYSAGYNFVSVQGEIINRIVYVVEDNESKILVAYNNVSFKQEIEVENTNKDSRVFVRANVLHDEIKTTIDNKENQTTIVVENPIRVCVFTFESKTLATISDLYSTKNETLVGTQSFDNLVVYDAEYNENKIEGSFTLDSEQPRVDKLLAVTNVDVVLVNSYVKDDTQTIEGVANSTIVYLNDELGSVNSVQIDFPFVINNKTDVSANVEAITDIALSDVDVMVKKGRDVYFDAKVKSISTYFGNEQNAVISNLSVGEELPPKDAPIEIYFADTNEKVWDIAKLMKVKEETIFEQNPNITDPIEENTKIVLYYK